MYYVKVEGKTLKDLKAGLERHLAELEGYGEQTVSVDTKVKVSKPKAPVAVKEEYEEVESPYSQPELVPAIPRNTVVDNELDAEGIPWDSRIHSSSKAKVKNGTWKIARGISDEQAAPVKAELRNRVTSAQPVQAAPLIPQGTPVQEYLQPAPVAQAPVVAPPAAAPIPTFNHSGHTVDTFKTNFPMIIATLITEGKINQDYVNSLKQYFNLSEIWMANDEQKAMVFDQFVQYGFVQKVG